MKWLARAAIYAVKEMVRPLLEECGKKIGEAIGSKVGRKVDPESYEDKDGNPEDEVTT